MSSLRDRKSSRIEEADGASGLSVLSAPRLPEVVIGTIAGIADDGSPFVKLPGNPRQTPLAALSTGGVGADAVGREVALLFVEGDPARPLVIGLLHRPQTPSTTIETPTPEMLEARLDGERVVLKARQEIVLECGKASVTLTRAGKVLIRGAYLLSRSSGVNRIKGGSVQIN